MIPASFISNVKALTRNDIMIDIAPLLLEFLVNFSAAVFAGVCLKYL